MFASEADLEIASQRCSEVVPIGHLPARWFVSLIYFFHVSSLEAANNSSFSVLFASIYRFTTIMQFQIADTTCRISRTTDK